MSCQSSREEPSFTSERICSTRLREAGTRTPFVTASAKSLLGASESTFTSTPSLSTVMRVQAGLAGEGGIVLHPYPTAGTEQLGTAPGVAHMADDVGAVLQAAEGGETVGPGEEPGGEDGFILHRVSHLLSSPYHTTVFPGRQ